LNVGTGLVFVTGNVAGGPMAYLGNLAFQIKMLLIVIAGAYYFIGIAREVVAVAAGEAAPQARSSPSSRSSPGSASSTSAE
jgi:hypothetical protein